MVKAYIPVPPEVCTDFSTPLEDFDVDDVWVTRNGRSIPIPYMSDRHLLNAINFLAECECCGWRAAAVSPVDSLIGQIMNWLERLEDELRWRRERNVRVEEFNNPYYRGDWL